MLDKVGVHGCGEQRMHPGCIWVLELKAQVYDAARACRQLKEHRCLPPR